MSLDRLVTALLGADASPVERRDAAMGLVVHIEGAPATPGPFGGPLVDVWRMAAWAGGLRDTLALLEPGASVLAIEPDAVELIAGLVGAVDPRVTVVEQRPKAGRRTVAALKEHLGIDAELRFVDLSTWTPEERFDVGIAYRFERALRGACTEQSRRLAGFCAHWLPTRIEVMAELVDFDDGRVVPMGAAAVLHGDGLETRVLDVPGAEAWGDQVQLATTVALAGHVLGANQSGLTQSAPLPPDARPLPGGTLAFRWDPTTHALSCS